MWILAHGLLFLNDLPFHSNTIGIGSNTIAKNARILPAHWYPSFSNTMSPKKREFSTSHVTDEAEAGEGGGRELFVGVFRVGVGHEDESVEGPAPKGGGEDGDDGVDAERRPSEPKERDGEDLE